MANTVPSHKLGPGSLKIGATGTEAELAVALREAAVEPDVKEEDDLEVLSGDIIPGEAEETAKLTGKLLQSYNKDSFLVWAHANNGKRLPFVFRPDNDKALGVKGECIVRRLTIGGKVKERNESDFEFKIVGGDYKLFDLTTGEGVEITTWTAPTPAVVPNNNSTEEWN